MSHVNREPIRRVVSGVQVTEKTRGQVLEKIAKERGEYAEATARSAAAGPDGRFWLFVWARQRAWLNRLQGWPREAWTPDPVMATARFTNVYRELDRGTIHLAQWLEHEIAKENIYGATRNRCLMLMSFGALAYRLFNRVETWEYFLSRPALNSLPNMLLDALNGGHAFAQAVKELKEARRPVLTGAYICCGSADTVHKAVASVAAYAQWMANTFTSDKASIEQVYQNIKRFDRFGDFMAYQSTLDMTYKYACLDGQAICRAAESTQNSWVKLGPGAVRGAALVRKDLAPSFTADMLRQSQFEGFLSIGVFFDNVITSDGTKVPLSLPNIEHALCEYQKWCRTMEGGHVKTIYSEPVAGSWRPETPGLPYWGVWEGYNNG